MSRRKTQKRKRGRPRFARHERPGTMPGTLIAHPEAKSTSIRCIAYDKKELIEEELESVAELLALLKGMDDSVVKWVDVTGLSDIDALKQIGDHFGLHMLALEDVLNVHQRAKVDAYEDHLFAVARRVAMDDEGLESEQISFFLAEGIVISLQERTGDCFEQVRDRLRKSRGRIRSMAADYLLYALVDSVIDSYFPVVDAFADRLDTLEETLTHHPGNAVLADIHQVRTDLLMLRRSLRPHRDAINSLSRDNDQLIRPDTGLFLRDCNDHVAQLMELIELYRETCAGLREHHLSMNSARMSEIMKVLTIISTIFIPLSFVVGLYGMNFNTELPGNMPELNRPYGYVMVIGGMVVVVAGMVGFFWRKGWISGK